MVDDYYCGSGRFTQGIDGADIGGHVGIVQFAASETAIERVENDEGWRFGARPFDCGYQIRAFSHQIERDRHEIERHLIGRVIFGQKLLTPSLDARLCSCLSLKGTQHHWALLHLPATVFSTEGDVQSDIQHPEGLATLGGTPNHRDAVARNKPLHHVAALGVQPNAREGNEVDAGG